MRGTLPNRLRRAAEYVWQGDLYDLIIEAAVALEKQPQERKPLTYEEIAVVLDRAKVTEIPSVTLEYDIEIVRAIEAAHGIKGVRE